MIFHEQDWEAYATWVKQQQTRGYRVVFTNGCFDLIHAGHIHLLLEAKRLGDLLVVGVNTDESTRRLKGPDRPIIPLDDRLIILSAIAMVDVLVVFPREADQTERAENDFADTPYGLLKRVNPDVLVKGGDYRPEEVIGREFAKEVRIVPLLEGRSTSRLISELGRLATSG